MRLTEKTDSGNWSLRDVPWDQLKPGAVITEKTWKKIYGALWKLKDYEDTGLEPDGIGQLNAETQEQAKAMLKRIAEISEEIEQMKKGDVN